MNSLAQLAISLVLLSLGTCARSHSDAAGTDRTVAGPSAYPTAVDPQKVGTYPGVVKSGAGYFYDDVLEYRVWLHPGLGAVPMAGGNDYFLAFAQYERALAFSQKSEGAEEPLVLILQLQYVNEPEPRQFEVVSGKRLTEWKVQWLAGAKRTPGAVEAFMAEHRK